MSLRMSASGRCGKTTQFKFQACDMRESGESSAQGWLESGQRKLKEGDYDGAVAHCCAASIVAAQNDPLLASALAVCAVAYLRKGWHEHAISCCRRSLELEKNQPKLWEVLHAAKMEQSDNAVSSPRSTSASDSDGNLKDDSTCSSVKSAEEDGEGKEYLQQARGAPKQRQSMLNIEERTSCSQPIKREIYPDANVVGSPSDEPIPTAGSEIQNIKTETNQQRSQLQDSSWPVAEHTEDSESFVVEQHVQWLEKSSNAKLDDCALRSLWALPAKDAKGSLRRVEDWGRDASRSSATWHCDNLSSIVQSLCPKIEKRSNTSKAKGASNMAAQGGKISTTAPPQKSIDLDTWPSLSPSSEGLYLNASKAAWPHVKDSKFGRGTEGKGETPDVGNPAAVGVNTSPQRAPPSQHIIVDRDGWPSLNSSKAGSRAKVSKATWPKPSASSCTKLAKRALLSNDARAQLAGDANIKSEATSSALSKMASSLEATSLSQTPAENVVINAIPPPPLMPPPPRPPSVSPEEAEVAQEASVAYRVGDHVSALFYGEWYPAQIRALSGGSRAVEVLWDSEWSVSVVPESDIRLVCASTSKGHLSD